MSKATNVKKSTKTAGKRPFRVKATLSKKGNLVVESNYPVTVTAKLSGWDIQHAVHVSSGGPSPALKEAWAKFKRLQAGDQNLIPLIKLEKPKTGVAGG